MGNVGGQAAYPDRITIVREIILSIFPLSPAVSGIFPGKNRCCKVVLCEPLIKRIADDNGLRFEKAKQNRYPECTLFNRKRPNGKIAVDVKSTYRQLTEGGALKPFGFTLGSYRSYLRSPTKGILYPYDQYSEHWVSGFLYTRNTDSKFTEIKQVIEASQLQPPFSDIEYFVQSKYRIAGKTPGSGNTTDIGSIKSNDIEVFRAWWRPVSHC